MTNKTELPAKLKFTVSDHLLHLLLRFANENSRIVN